MAERGEFDPQLVVTAEPQVSSLASTSSEDGDIVFPYRLPDDGLALRSVRISNGVPELLFDASPKVPTLTEEDIATIFRLVSEDKRPEFFYNYFPSTHPMYQCRFFKQYSPTWLRQMPVGKLLAEADWIMKCLHVGTRANKEKSIFKSWSAESQLEGLASRLDFPEDGFGPIMMTCEYVKVQKGHNEIIFPEEPKMRITDWCSSVYSKYITEIYPSVAYHDEPLLLKMQELIKLIVAIEWLCKEKGIRANQEWVMQHTSKQTAHLKPDTRKKPPYDMIPKPTVFKRPSSDVTVKTIEALQYETLKTECGVERQYGYCDFSSEQILMFREDGTPCPPEKCLKFSVEQQLRFLNIPVAGRKTFHILPLPEPTKNELLPKNTHQEIIASLVPASDSKVEDLTDERGVDLRVTNSIQACPWPLSIATKVTTCNSNKQYSDEDPQMPIPRFDGALIPDVKSWDELITELSVPIPHIRHNPFIGIGEPINSGGVTTSSFRVQEEPMPAREDYEETRRTGNFQRSGSLLGVHAERIRNQGKIQLVSHQSEFARVSGMFSSTWIKGTLPSVKFVFAISNSYLKQKWEEYKQTLGCHNSIEQHYHGTTLACNLITSQTLCSNGNCGICGISCSGLDPQYIRTNIPFQRFGKGFYLAPNSSKCHDYTKGAHGYKAMLLCDVLPGRKYTLTTNDQNLTGPPPGYNCVFGQVAVGSKLNYPEIVLYERHAIMPRYIIMYEDLPANN